MTYVGNLGGLFFKKHRPQKKMFFSPGKMKKLTYCWWTKSCTTKDDDYPVIYKVLYIPGGAGFLPSTVSQWKNSVPGWIFPWEGPSAALMKVRLKRMAIPFAWMWPMWPFCRHFLWSQKCPTSLGTGDFNHPKNGTHQKVERLEPENDGCPSSESPFPGDDFQVPCEKLQGNTRILDIERSLQPYNQKPLQLQPPHTDLRVSGAEIR